MNKNVYGYVYMIRNKVNGKLYFGITVNDFQTRYYGNILKYTHNEHLKHSIKKYGIENFEINEQFDVAYNEDDLYNLEDMYICLYDTIKNGYNVRRSGAKCKGRGHFDMTDETKNKMSDSAKRIVVCLNNEKIFTSMLDAMKWIDGRTDKTGTGNISLVCTNDVKYAYQHPITGENLVWAYYEDYVNMSQEEIDSKILAATTDVLNDSLYMDMDKIESVSHKNTYEFDFSTIEALNTISKMFTDVQKYVFKEYFLQGDTLDIIAKRHNVSKARIGSVKDKIIKKITEKYTYEEFANLIK